MNRGEGLEEKEEGKEEWREKGRARRNKKGRTENNIINQKWGADDEKGEKERWTR